MYMYNLLQVQTQDIYFFDIRLWICMTKQGRNQSTITLYYTMVNLPTI